MNPKSMLPWIQKLLAAKFGQDRAQQAIAWAEQKFDAGNYQNNRSGIMKALSDAQVSHGQLNQMLGYLNNPIANSILGTFAPNLASSLRNIGQEVTAEMGGAQAPPRQTVQSGVNNEFPPLRKR